MNTKKKKAAGLLLLVLLIGTLTACSALLSMFALPLTIDQRVEAFAEDINSADRTAANILANFGPAESMTEYGKAEAISYWDNAFPAVYTYTFTVGDKTDPASVTVTGTKKTTAGNLISEPTYTFKMHEETGGNFLIQEITDGTTVLIKTINF